MCLFFLNFRRTSPSTLLPLCVVYNFHHRDPVNTKDLDIQKVQKLEGGKMNNHFVSKRGRHHTQTLIKANYNIIPSKVQNCIYFSLDCLRISFFFISNP